MTILAVLFIAYGFIGLAIVRPIAGHFAWSFKRNQAMLYPSLYAQQSRPTGDQWFGGFCLALVVGALWPVACIWLAVGRFAPRVGAERDAVIAEQRKRIEQLEREAGIR